MGYDAHTNQLVLYGGFDDDYPLGDTWIWNGTDWKDAHATNPRDNSGEMAYDAANKELTLFGSDGEVHMEWLRLGGTPPRRPPVRSRSRHHVI
ncbi:MAG: hypothetical protein WB765_14830 [Acidimicrobiales bacterium]